MYNSFLGLKSSIYEKQLRFICENSISHSMLASVLRLVLAKPLRVSTAYYVRSGGQV